MKIGVPIEIKNNENRVGMTPSGVFELAKRNHTVYVQKNAGFNSGFLDEDYVEAGAVILETIEDVYATAEMIVKVKEPIEQEYTLIKPHALIKISITNDAKPTLPALLPLIRAPRI